MFNSITKKLKGDQNQQKVDKNLEGFICPVCMASFVSPEMVQQHFEDKHPEDGVQKSSTDTLFSPNTQRKESIRDIQENLNDLRQSLDEEVWYNEELKKECTRLNSVITEKDNEIIKRDKTVEDFSKQIVQLEAARNSLNEELKNIHTLKTSLTEENKTIRADFSVCEEKLIKSERSREKLQNECQRQKQECAILSDKISKLKGQSDTTNVDDEKMIRLNEQLAEVSQELQTSKEQLLEVSTNFENMKSLQNNSLLELEDKYTKLIKHAEKLEVENVSLLQSKENISSAYQLQLNASVSECDDLKKKLETLKVKVNESEDNLMKMRRSFESEQTQLKEANLQLTDSVEKYQELKIQNKEFIQRIKNQEMEVLQIRNVCNNKEEEIKTLERTSKNYFDELQVLKQELDAEKKAKDTLKSQVEMGDAANIVIEQMQEEKENLQENFDILKIQLSEEREHFNVEANQLRIDIQLLKEENLKLTSSVCENEEKIKESEKVNNDSQIVCEKYQQKINEEKQSRLNLEDEIFSLKRNLENTKESLNTYVESNLSLKKENQIALKHLEEEKNAKDAALASLTKEIEAASLKVSRIEVLQKEVVLAKEKIYQLEKGLQEKTTDFDNFAKINELLMKSESDLKQKLNEMEKNIKELENIIKIKEDEIESHKNALKQQQITNNNTISRIKVLDDELVMTKESLVNLAQERDEKMNEVISCKQSIENLESALSKMLKDKSVLESEIIVIKNQLLEQQDYVSLLSKEKLLQENICIEKENDIEKLKKNIDSISAEKDNVNAKLSIAKIEISEIQSLYSESMMQKDVMENELKVKSEDLLLTKKELSEVEERYKQLQSEYETDTERWTKESIQLKNHVKAIEKTLNESSENYKQESLESTERELTLKSHCEDLESKMTKLNKSFQLIEEDLESEKCLRQTERSNMMEKISQLTDQLTQEGKLRNDLDQKLESVETDYIENKLRLETAMDEKEKLLEKIIQMENSFKRQTEGFSKKCREFDQLQSAILDLGRENQSLQITKERITSRLWVVDDEAVECHNCHKMFSLTNRKHHCRNCGQVFCQDCSTKTATLAVSRKPVRVCDICHLEVHSHRRNSSTQSSNISLSLQN